MSQNPTPPVRVGIPYRTRKEELTGDFAKIEKYVQAVRNAAAEPVVLSLGFSTLHLKKIAGTLDAILLTGSPADILPANFGAQKHPECADADLDRERTDFALLEHAFAERKPVLAICYGIQSLNVFLGGTLVQDIPSEVPGSIEHDPSGDEDRTADLFHPASIDPGSRLSTLAQAAHVEVNSSHHQAILQPGQDLEIVSRAPDGVVEAVELKDRSHWVMGVQWHPERIFQTHPLAQTLFRELVAAARPASQHA